MIHLESVLFQISWILDWLMGGKLSAEELAERHVVIIGGGYAGMELGTILLKWEVPFTIIDPKEYFHHIVGGLRAVVDKGMCRNNP